jgi:hypothetical protein
VVKLFILKLTILGITLFTFKSQLIWTENENYLAVLRQTKVHLSRLNVLQVKLVLNVHCICFFSHVYMILTWSFQLFF